MGHLSVVFIVSLAGLLLAYGFPVGTTSSYPHGSKGAVEADAQWAGGKALHVALPGLALLCTAVGLLLGCTWCYRHKDCKPNEGAGNQLFTASATHLHEGSPRRPQPPQPPDSGFSEPANNNVSEDNNNGPISLREMQNIANNNAAAYIVSDNEERNRPDSRESVVEFEPLPAGLGAVGAGGAGGARVAADPLERCADWFVGANEEIPRNRLQYLREIGRGWFGRIVEGDIERDNEDSAPNSTVAVKILNQSASRAEKARFLNEARLYRDVRHENVLRLIAHCLREEPWIIMFELCPMDLQQYLIINSPKMAILNESGVTLRLKCDIAAALSYIHSLNFVYGSLWSGAVLVRGEGEHARAVLGRYATDAHAPNDDTTSSDVWSLGVLLWEVCSWGATPGVAPLPEPALPCPYRSHLYQVMQLCWNENPESRPTASQVHALLNHLYANQQNAAERNQDGNGSNNDFEERWQGLKPNTIPKVDEHIAIVHAPSVSMTSHFTGSDQDIEDNTRTIQDTLSVDLDAGVSRSSSIMSDKDPLSVHIKSESLTNLHGSLDDVRNIYLHHSENTTVECQQENILDRDADNSDSFDAHKVDPWLKDIVAGSQDDVSYYRDVSDVIKNLDNILNSEKTSSSESSHQASPSRDNLTLDCKNEYSLPSSLVKSPGISNFQNILNMTPEHKATASECLIDDYVDRETFGTLDHSFERHSDTNSQSTLENVTPDTPHVDVDPFSDVLASPESHILQTDTHQKNIEVNCNSVIPKLKDLCLVTVNSEVSLRVLEEVNINSEMKSIPNETEVSHDSYNIAKDDDIKTYKSLNSSIDEQNDTLNEIVKKIDIENESNLEHTENSNVSHKPECSKESSGISDHSTVYMDLINCTNSEIIHKSNAIEIDKDFFGSCIDQPDDDTCNTLMLNKNESTVYLDLPTVINETHKLLNSERSLSSLDVYTNDNINFNEIIASTPKGSETSAVHDTLDKSKMCNDSKESVSTIEMADFDSGVTVTKFEQQSVPDSLSPFDSPTKSHPTDTFDENSSVLLGPFENCSLDLFRNVKNNVTPSCEYADVPREEFLAFSSNFTEINLETPSPLRDGKFLIAVPDIDINEDSILDVRETLIIPTDVVDLNKPTTVAVDNTGNCELDLPPLSPTTPPNSPGNFLSNSPVHKYLIENIADPLQENLPDPILENNDGDDEIELNQIELQITTKFAMAENENNLNIEHLGPLVDEAFTEPTLFIRNTDGIEEIYLAGNCASQTGELETVDVDDGQEGQVLLEESMRALRNELELKLPLAQSVNIEPPADNDSWSGELPPPPELVVNYSCLLSPIVEETKHQLSAYENDRPWTVSNKTDSSESYPEPCNNSTDEVTELPTAAAQSVLRDSPHSGCFSPSINNVTYTIQKDLTMSKEVTMSEDSLNHKLNCDNQSPIDCVASKMDRISQVTPCILSPSTDSSVPEQLQSENVTGVSTFSKPSFPTDAKSSKPSETQCPSKATSIDSWCSNDTLYNVEDNFDDLAIDPDLPIDLECGQEVHNSNSTGTLTCHEDDEELSHCPTYIVHDSKSEACDSFTPDSITGNHTYTKPKIEIGDNNSPSVLVKSEINDSPMKNSQMKDLAYATVVSSCNSHLGSYSNCTTAPEDPWKMYQPPEMVRQSPMPEETIMSPPHDTEDDKNNSQEVPNLSCETKLSKMDSVDITSCLKDHSLSHYDQRDEQSHTNAIQDALPNTSITRIQIATSTPLTEVQVDDGSAEVVKLTWPKNHSKDDKHSFISISPKSQTKQYSELTLGDLSSVNENNIAMIDASAGSLSEWESQSGSKVVSMISPGYVDFQDSAAYRPQDIHKSKPFLESFQETSNSVIDFHEYQNSICMRPQDLSAIESSKLLLKHENKSNESVENLLAINCDPIRSVFSIAENNLSEIYPPVEQSLLILSPQVTIDSKNETVNNHIATDNTDASRRNDSCINKENMVDMLSTNENPLCGTLENTRQSKTLAPLLEVRRDVYDKAIPLHWTQDNSKSDELVISSTIPNYETFVQSAEKKPQDLSIGTNSDLILEDLPSVSKLSTVTSDCPKYDDSHAAQIPDLSNLNNTSLLLHSDSKSLITKIDCDVDIEVKLPVSHHCIESTDRTSDSTSESCDKESNISTVTQLNLGSNMATNSFNENESQSVGPKVTNITSDFTSCNLPKTNNVDISSFEQSSPNDISDDQTKNCSNNQMFDSHVKHNETYDSHVKHNETFDSHADSTQVHESLNGHSQVDLTTLNEGALDASLEKPVENTLDSFNSEISTKVASELQENDISPKPENEAVSNSKKYATLNYIKETFEELLESNVDDVISLENDISDNIKGGTSENNADGSEINIVNPDQRGSQANENCSTNNDCIEKDNKTKEIEINQEVNDENVKLTTATKDFLLNEKYFCHLTSYLPLLSDIRFTGPGDDCMTTSFNQESPTEDRTETLDSEEKRIKENGSCGGQTIKEWDSDSDDSHSSSGEFIWKDGEGHETCVVSSTRFQHQGLESCGEGGGEGGAEDAASGDSASESGDSGSSSGDSGSGSEGDELEFVPSSWDCRAEPAKSSLRSLEQTPPEGKKHVVFKLQKYHSVYEYPREVSDACDALRSPYLPDYSTYREWDAASAEEAERGYGQMFASPAHELYHLPPGVAFGNDYDDDFYISSTARPFEPIGVMATSSQFFPGMRALKAEEQVAALVAPPPPASTLSTPSTPSTPALELVTPDSGVEDVTPGSLAADDEVLRVAASSSPPPAAARRAPSPTPAPAPASPSTPATPATPAGEALGGLRHTRDRLKLDLPPSPRTPLPAAASPRSPRIFNFADAPLPRPTFSTFGKSAPHACEEERVIFLDEVPKRGEVRGVEEVVGGVEEAVKGEGTVLDSGDEDSGIESSAQATLERGDKPAPAPAPAPAPTPPAAPTLL